VGNEPNVETTNFLANKSFLVFNDTPFSSTVYSEEFTLLTTIKSFDEGDCFNKEHNNYYDYDFQIAFAVTNGE
jgi:hypothetical protein